MGDEFDSTTAQSGKTTHQENWLGPRPGNIYIMESTWIRNRETGDLGVVTGFPDIHESGTVEIAWYPNSVDLVSARMFRNHLREGKWALDETQIPESTSLEGAW